jgi:hypothetical protein
MDAEGNVLAKHEEERTAEGFAKTGEKVKDFYALKAKADKGDKEAQVNLAITQLELGHLKAEEVQEKLSKLGPLSAPQKAKLDGLLIAAEVREVLKTVTNEKATQLAAGKKFLEMNRSGKPAPIGEEDQPYWILIMDYAESQKDAKAFELGLQALKARFGSNPQAAEFFKRKDATLKTLKEKE